jgi:hypothetical protein
MFGTSMFFSPTGLARQNAPGVFVACHPWPPPCGLSLFGGITGPDDFLSRPFLVTTSANRGATLKIAPGKFSP